MSRPARIAASPSAGLSAGIGELAEASSEREIRSMLPELDREVNDAHDARDVVCFTGTWKKARIAAQVVADTEQRPVYVLQGFRPSRRSSPRRSWSFAYYVSRREVPRIYASGLPEGCPVPRLVRTILPGQVPDERSDGGS